MGSFILALNDAPLPVPASPKKRKVGKKRTENARCKDMREVFSRETRQERNKKKNSHDHDIITIVSSVISLRNDIREKEKKTEFLSDFKVLMLYAATIDIAECLNCNDLSMQG